MEKTIKMIDLLYKIANGEEAPKKIRYFGEEFKLAKDNEYYSVYSSRPLISYFGEDYLRAELNDEVEILDEEEFEDIYNFCWNENYLFSNRQTGMTKEDRRLLDSNFKDIHDTINKLIKNQKKIIERLNNLGE